jgi:hypothetical protein
MAGTAAQQVIAGDPPDPIVTTASDDHVDAARTDEHVPVRGTDRGRRRAEAGRNGLRCHRRPDQRAGADDESGNANRNHCPLPC